MRAIGYTTKNFRTQVRVPPDRVSLILAVDWFLDRFRTSLNVTGDSIGCAVVQAMVKNNNLHACGLSMIYDHSAALKSR